MDAVSRAFLISAMRPIGPYPFLAVEGEQGSGKSTACEMTKRIIDPTTTLRASLPETVENLLVMASHCHLSVFDNVSGMRGEISDGLAKLATGGGYEKRKLYSDGDLFSIDICRPFALNGIGDFIHRADLMDRGIVLRLEAPPPGKRKTEAAMLKEFEALLPELLHDLYTAVSCAIRNLEKTPQRTELRMADAAHWLVAAEPETGLSRGTIIETLLKTQAQAQIDLVANDPIFAELRRVTSERPFEGTAQELLSKVQRDELRFDRSFPKSAPQLSKKLRRLAPALAKAGLIVEFSRKSKMRGLKVSQTLSQKEMPESEGTKPRYEAGEF